ncbi:MAG: DUF1566 domain-containing protein [Candidatus Lokiarchaeota archaeon]|nr:DUF1566 domain-containing protein [Candidatus Lokiarchaeota archaeon]
MYKEFIYYFLFQSLIICHTLSAIEGQSNFSTRKNNLLITSEKIDYQVEKGYIYGGYLIEPFTAYDDNQKAIRLVDISFYRLYFETQNSSNMLHIQSAWKRHHKEVQSVISLYRNIDNDFIALWIHDYLDKVALLVVRMEKFVNKSFSEKMLETLDAVSVGASYGAKGVEVNMSVNIGELIKLLRDTNILSKFEDLLDDLKAKQMNFTPYAQKYDYKSNIELKIIIPSGFRNSSKMLMDKDVDKMLKTHNYFCSKILVRSREGHYKQYSNQNGNGFDNHFFKYQNNQIVFDGASGLMWEQSGSDIAMNFSKIIPWIEKLNGENYLGYSDWRLPTLEEAMSLMETKKHDDLYIDQVFNNKQNQIWTCDYKIWDRQMKFKEIWVVCFDVGDCYHYFPNNMNKNFFYTRLVRSVR